MNKKVLTISFGMIFSLTACTMTPQECDPSISDPSLLDKMGCVFSGSYETRIETKKANIKALRGEQRRLLQESEELLSESRLVHGTLNEKQKSLDKFELELMDMQERLEEKQALSSSLKARFDKAQNQISTMKKTGSNASLLQKQKEYEALKREVDALNSAFNN